MSFDHMLDDAASPADAAEAAQIMAEATVNDQGASDAERADARSILALTTDELVARFSAPTPPPEPARAGGRRRAAELMDIGRRNAAEVQVTNLSGRPTVPTWGSLLLARTKDDHQVVVVNNGGHSDRSSFSEAEVNELRAAIEEGSVVLDAVPFDFVHWSRTSPERDSDS